MRKLVVLLSAILAIAASAVALTTPTAGADPGNGALRYVACPFVAAQELDGFMFNMCFSDVVTPSGNANAHFHGSLVDPTTAPSRTVVFTGFECFAAFPNLTIVTTDSRVVFTPSGQVSGTCFFH